MQTVEFRECYRAPAVDVHRGDRTGEISYDLTDNDNTFCKPYSTVQINQFWQISAYLKISISNARGFAQNSLKAGHFPLHIVGRGRTEDDNFMGMSYSNTESYSTIPPFLFLGHRCTNIVSVVILLP